jgi:hypothetical protein
MRPILAAGIDTAAVLVFVGIGRAAHADGVTISGMASTSWPFLAGAATGWAFGRARRHPTETVPAGVAVWLACVVVGMTLRVLSGQGTAPGFIAVALGFLGAAIVGWRVLFQLVRPAA